MAIRDQTEGPDPIPRWAWLLLVFGLYLTLRGYHAFDGDQAYRLPLLHHLQDPSVFAEDPFVRAFDRFNPHRGYLTLLDRASRPFGLATALFGLFVATFAATSIGVGRLARSVWPRSGSQVGLVAVVLVLVAKAGNIGTNHLFESTLLDRLIGFALGWLALALTLEGPGRGTWSGSFCLALASLIHPSVGLQLALTLASTWFVWGLVSGWSRVSLARACLAIAALGAGQVLAFALAFDLGVDLFRGLPRDEFRLLAVMIQGPQHMVPSTWRASQWLAWGCYPALALLALAREPSWPAARIRLAALIGVNLISLAVAYVAVEILGDLRVTVFQPFRMATLARGLCLVAISGRMVALWNQGDFASRARAVLVGVGLSGDWSMVVATAVDLGMAGAEWASRGSRRTVHRVGLGILVPGLVFLGRHDTESGHLSVLAGLAVLALGSFAIRGRSIAWTRRRWAFAMVGAWTIPVGAMLVPLVETSPGQSRWSASLVERCRFAEIPTDDLERLAVWCREQTPASSRFIGPPGPKTFRLWSRRALAFNRAASPYQAEGLADWASRYRDHVGFDGSTAEFARAYLKDRHTLEARFGRMTDEELAELARRQGATYVLTASNRPPGDPKSPLERIQIQGRYAVSRVRPVEAGGFQKISKKNSSGALFNSF